MYHLVKCKSQEKNMKKKWLYLYQSLLKSILLWKNQIEKIIFLHTSNYVSKKYEIFSVLRICLLVVVNWYYCKIGIFLISSALSNVHERHSDIEKSTAFFKSDYCGIIMLLLNGRYHISFFISLSTRSLFFFNIFYSHTKNHDYASHAIAIIHKHSDGLHISSNKKIPYIIISIFFQSKKASGICRW